MRSFLSLAGILLCAALYGQNMTTTDLTGFVNPFIGTQRMGHTYPGATAPFGMVQLSPETRVLPMFIDGKYNADVYKYCSGYQYDDSTIYGFSHTHFSGTGHSDLGDFLLMPQTGSLKAEPGDPAQPGSGWYSSFSHKREKASPGYYSVHLDRYNIQAELTASERTGFHRYTFPATDSAHILLDLTYNIYNYEGKNVWTFVRVENDSTVSGYRQTSGWGRTRTVYFVMQFSKPFAAYGHKKYDKTPYNGFYRKFNETENFPEMAGHDLRAWFRFRTEKNEKIGVKFALSSVSTAGAMLNLQTEVPHWDFDRVRNETRNRWNGELSRVQVETLTPADKQTFYTALYHT
ncbi:MAG: glycoside hydrolase family 92 protein, partial [Bacteroidia bacterium]|nr:glycoside hydrolase family 92 protein [Bacteroidia bacterium]